MVSNVAIAVNFYVNELRLFGESHDYGMGNILLKNIENNSFCLLLKERDEFHPSTNEVLFTIGVNDAKSLFESYQARNFQGDAGIVAFENSDSFVEYPLGKTFVLQDPDRNRFSICEWHENAI